MWIKNSKFRLDDGINICKKSNKRIYRTHTHAENVVDRVWEQRKEKRYYYKCGNHYHITSQQSYNNKGLKTSKSLEGKNVPNT